MADAARQLALAQYLLESDNPEGIRLGRALSRKLGGTGFSVDTLGELQDELGIVNPFAIAGVEGGFAPLDSGLLVPRASLPELTAATDTAGNVAGTKGAAPGAPINSHMRALRGDASYSNALEIDQIFATSNLTKRALKISSVGDGEDYLIAAARGSGTQNARLVVNSSVDTFADLRLEPLGDAAVTQRGNQLVRRNRTARRAMVNPDDGSWVLNGGLAAPTEFGTPSMLEGARGVQREFLLASGAGGPHFAGVVVPLKAERRWNPDVLIVWEASLFVDVRVWVGLFSGTPNADDPTSVQGIGIRFNGASVGGEPTNHWRAWGCNGTTSTTKVLDGTSGNGLYQPEVNVAGRLLIRNQRQALGVFELLVQRGAQDAGVNEGDWTYLATFDSATEGVPLASTNLSAYVIMERLSGTATRNIRAKLIDFSQI